MQHEKKLSATAQRQAAFSARQRELGRSKLTIWVDPDEARQIKELVEKNRSDQNG